MKPVTLIAQETLPASYRDIVAVMMAYNEADVIESSIGNLTQQGVGVYLIDNWSTDDTAARAKKFIGRGLVGIERYPEERPSAHFALKPLLKRAEEIHFQLGARWCLHLDADEISTAPWPYVPLPEALRRVEMEGCNTVNHISLFFQPIDNGYAPGTDMERYFRYFEVGQKPWDHKQLRIWKNPGYPVELGDGGHQVAFDDQRLFPLPFLKKHYAIRSQAHGERKILQERLGRFDPEERSWGWHCHYDEVTQTTHFVRDASTLMKFDEVETKQYFLDHPPEMPIFDKLKVS